MIDLKLVIQNIIFINGPMTRNQIFDELVRKTQIRETRENFDMIVDELIDKCRLIKVGGKIV